MILYVLKSSLSLFILFGFYKLFLENEKLHHFNRFYLLFSLLFSLTVPLLSFEVDSDFIPSGGSQPVYRVDSSLITQLTIDGLPSRPMDTPTSILTLIYWLVTSAMLFRFARNIVSLIQTINSHPKLFDQGTTIVLLAENCLPHTFLHYLFVSRGTYQKQAIERELFTHELAHINQKHSVDILFIELIISFFWINPVLLLMRRAIRLNHEFLADSSVNKQHRDVINYQRLLLSKLTLNTPISLTSSLTFQTTKQRFMMMTKRTSRTRALIAGGSVAALFALLTVTFCTRSVAQSTATLSQEKPQTNIGQPKSRTDTKRLEQHYKDKLVVIPTKGTQVVKKKFSDLSETEKKGVILIGPQPRKTPTEAQFAEWKNPKMFGIWIDGKRVKNKALDGYKSDDIASFSGSYVHKNARQPEGYLYQMDLMTHQEYDRYLKERTESPFLVIVPDSYRTARKLKANTR